MINPCTEDVREVDMKIRILPVGLNQCISKDNVKVSITSSVAYRVINPVMVYYVLGSALNRGLI